jgi:hypothetical protein
MEPIDVPFAPTSEQIRSELNNGIFLLLFTLVLAAVLGGAVVYAVVDHSRFMRDAQRDTGIVQSVESETRRGRRGRTTIDYYATLEGRHGTVRLSIDEPVPVGSRLAYLYSPSMQSARIPGNTLSTMGLVGAVMMGCFVVHCGHRTYKNFRSWYRFANGYYKVVGPEIFYGRPLDAVAG